MSDSRKYKKTSSTKMSNRMEDELHYGNGKDLFIQTIELALKDMKKDEFEAYRQQQERRKNLKAKP